MSENNPWKKVGTYVADICLDDGDMIDVDVCLRTEVDAARAAEATQHRQEIAAKDETIRQGDREIGACKQEIARLTQEPFRLAQELSAARARLAAVEAERDAFKAENGEVRRLAVKERADLAAFADRAEAERDRHARHIDRAWAMLANCYDIESREECERSPLTHDGFLPLEMAIHAIYKRDPKVSELTAERDRLKAALSQITALDFEKVNGRHNLYSGAAMFVKAWLLACAALSGEGTAKP